MRARSAARFSLVVSTLASLAVQGPARGEPAKRPAFTSKYTPISSAARGPCKVTVEGQDGQDPVMECPALPGYKVELGFSAESTIVTISKGNQELVQLSALAHGPKLEWRLAGKTPFAVILRDIAYETDDTGAPTRKVASSTLRVRGLGGKNAGLSGDVDARASKDANQKARDLADAGFQAE